MRPTQLFPFVSRAAAVDYADRSPGSRHKTVEPIKEAAAQTAEEPRKQEEQRKQKSAVMQKKEAAASDGKEKAKRASTITEM